MQSNTKPPILNPELSAYLPDLLNTHPWTATLAIALVAVLAGMVLHRVVRSVLGRFTRHSVVLQAVLERAQRPAAAVVPLFALQAVWAAAPNALDYISTVRHGNALLLIAAFTWLAVSAVNGFADGLIARHPTTGIDNLAARRIQTQAHVLARSAIVMLVIGGTAMGLMTFPGARQLGASLLASAGVLGIVGGLAARPVFSNLIAGLQLAVAQPIRIDDVLIVKGENGRVEEITGTYVVLKLWDERRMIVPLTWFIENPFENWTRSNSEILQSVYLHLDFMTPVEPLRAQLQRVLESEPDWDRRVGNLMVVDTSERTMKVRILLSAQSSGTAFDLGCTVREKLIAFLAREYPDSLPRTRNANVVVQQDAPVTPPAGRDNPT